MNFSRDARDETKPCYSSAESRVQQNMKPPGMTMTLLYKLAKPFYLLTVSVVLFMHSALYLSMKDPEKGIKELKLEKDKS